MAGSRDTLRDLHRSRKKEGSGCGDLAVLLTLSPQAVSLVLLSVCVCDCFLGQRCLL